MINALWSILGKPEKKFVIIISKTQEQAKNHFSNIKNELQNNELLKEDFGPFTEHEGMWNKMSLELEYHGAKIMSVTREQSIRGLKYNQYRPDLIICDDLEDISSALNPIESENLYNHFKSEIVSVGSSNTRIIVLGNLISKDSFMMRLKKEIEQDNTGSFFRAYPLYDDNGRHLWLAKFPDHESISKIREKSGEMWGREYLLDFNDPGVDDGKAKRLFDKLMNAKEQKIFHRKFQEIDRKWKKNKNKTQIPLIKQMGRFSISAPVIEHDHPDPNDPNYMEYEKAIKELIEQLDVRLENIMTGRPRSAKKDLRY